MSDEAILETESIEDTYTDVRCDGNVVASVDLDDWDRVQLRLYDPKDPTECLVSYKFDRVTSEEED